MYEQQGNSRKDAMKLAAKDRGVSKRDIHLWMEKILLNDGVIVVRIVGNVIVDD